MIQLYEWTLESMFSSKSQSTLILYTNVGSNIYILKYINIYIYLRHKYNILALIAVAYS